MGRTRNSTKFLKECMADALLELMKTKPIDKITVLEITEFAGVGRATWFRNFKTKTQALAFKVEMFFERAASENDLEDWRIYSAENAMVFFSFMYSIKDICKQLSDAGQKNAILMAMYNVLMPNEGVEDTFDKYTSRFYVYGLFGMIDQWINRDYAETPEELAKMVLKMTSHNAVM